MKADSLYRDTIRMSSKDNCDSVLFMEIIMHPVKRYTETKVLPQDSVLIWNGITITKNGTYTVEPTPTQAGNGCDSIVELRAVFEDVKRLRQRLLPDCDGTSAGDSFLYRIRHDYL